MKRIKTPELGTDKVKVYFDSEFDEYQVRIVGKPKATYFTSDKKDALSTAQAMRNSIAFS